MSELPQEIQQKIEQSKAMGPKFCATCQRPIDFENNPDIFEARDGRLWCNQWCATRPKVTR